MIASIIPAISSTGELVALAIVGAFIFGCHIAAWICYAKMATRLGRSAGWWFFLCIFINPYVGILCLYALGETTAHRKARILQEEEWKNSVSLKGYLGK